MKLIIAGCRDYNDYKFFKSILDQYLKDLDLSKIEIVHGNASGVDSMADRYANEHNIKVTKFPAYWKVFGKKAGPIRNRKMAEYGDYLIAFWDNKSRGTGNMIEEIKKLDKPHTVIYIVEFLAKELRI